MPLTSFGASPFTVSTDRICRFPLLTVFGFSTGTPSSDTGFSRLYFRGLRDRKRPRPLRARPRLAGRPPSIQRPGTFNLRQWCRNINLPSIDYAFGPRLRVRLTLGDLPSPGNLRLSANGSLTRFIVTRSGMITRASSRVRHRTPSPYRTTLSYRLACAKPVASVSCLVPFIIGAGLLDQ
jgi:hypothetical protein